MNPTGPRDAAHIAKTIRSLRELKKMKADTLAELARVNVRSIERAESGRHVPSEETLSQIAKAFGADLGIFDLRDEGDEALRRKVLEISKKTLLVPTAPLEKAEEILSAMTASQAYLHDFSAVSSDQALSDAAALVDAIREWGDCWEDISLTEQLAGCRDFVDRATALLELGYRAHIGTYRASELIGKGKSLRVTVLLVTFLSKDHPGRYAMVTLPDDMETLPEDRISVPE